MLKKVLCQTVMFVDRNPSLEIKKISFMILGYMKKIPVVIFPSVYAFYSC
jgi:hypothetical protein